MPSTLILLRHGQSDWNLQNRFTGWVDVDLSDTGMAEAKAGGEMMAAEGYKVDILFTSVLKRAIRTSMIALDVMDQLWVPVERSWRLNERHYGGLTGLNKAETAAKYGDDQVLVWRRSYATPPPVMDEDHPDNPKNDRRYQHLDIPVADIPMTESLATTLERVLPYWHGSIVPELTPGRTVMIAAHGNSLRALVKHLDNMSEDEIVKLNIPTGVPLVYELDDNLGVLSSRYLGDPEAVAAAAAAVANQGRA